MIRTTPEPASPSSNFTHISIHLRHQIQRVPDPHARWIFGRIRSRTWNSPVSKPRPSHSWLCSWRMLFLSRFKLPLVWDGNLKEECWLGPRHPTAFQNYDVRSK
ncbi:hypothetical protein AVEN_82381-1 [Araneus ventricosus]|uniref:Uncharacterized protein n=1 Tax=Araneus ventricosus TaxID=182803 RepID=A0A4Y2HIJ9_ARAVE|nr:hypothetical protein AVEN_82381-1 [Araneus ventricosus]